MHGKAIAELGFHSTVSGVTLLAYAEVLDYPTILDLAGDPAPARNVHGRSLLPLLANPAAPWRDSVVVEFHGLGGILCTMLTIRHGAIKYGWTPAGRDELYDLEKDPNEMANRIDDPDYAHTLRQMQLRLYAFMQESKHPAAYMFRQSRLGYTVDRHFLKSPDPQPLESLKIQVKW